MRTCLFVNFTVPADHEEKIKDNKKRDKYVDLRREPKKKTQKTLEHEGEGDTICNCCAWYNSKGSIK